MHIEDRLRLCRYEDMKINIVMLDLIRSSATSYLISVGFDIYGPLMCMSILFSFLSKIPGNVSEHDWLHDGNSLWIIKIRCL